MAGCTVLISQWYFGKARLGMLAKQGMAIELGGVIFLFIGGLLAVQHWALPLSLYLISWVFLAMLLLFVPRNHPQAQEAQEVQATQEHIISNKGLSLKHVYSLAVLAMVTFFSAIVLLPSTMHAQNYNEEQVGFLLSFISLVALVIGAVFSGIGFGFSIPLLNHMTVERSAASVRGRNLSYFTMAVFSGQFLTSFVEYIPGGTRNIFISCISLCALTALYLFVKKNHSQSV